MLYLSEDTELFGIWTFCICLLFALLGLLENFFVKLYRRLFR